MIDCPSWICMNTNTHRPSELSESTTMNTSPVNNQSTATPDTASTTTAHKSATKTACCEPSCCSPNGKTTATPPNSASPSTPATQAEAMRDIVREGYSKIAQTGSWSPAIAPANSPSISPLSDTPRISCCGTSASSCSTSPTDSTTKATGGCCGPSTFTPEQLAAAIGYSKSELAASPDEANMGLSCGNPTALASLKPGETVVDLGAGGGLDCFIAGARVGSTGRVIGVDMTPAMVSKARKNTPTYNQRTGFDNVEFRLGEIEHLPVADAAADVVISNCVLNLSPDKARVWREIGRVLRPGGRVAISDLVLLRPLPDSVIADAEALVGCIAGASLINDVQRWASDAGLSNIQIVRKPGYVDAMTNSDDPLYQAIIARLEPGLRIGDYITSADISARKA